MGQGMCLICLIPWSLLPDQFVLTDKLDAVTHWSEWRTLNRKDKCLKPLTVISKLEQFRLSCLNSISCRNADLAIDSGRGGYVWTNSFVWRNLVCLKASQRSCVGIVFKVPDCLILIYAATKTNMKPKILFCVF